MGNFSSIVILISISFLIYLTVFYKECFRARSDLNNISLRSYQDVMNQVIWDKKFILSDNNLCFDKHLIELRVIKRGETLFDSVVFLEVIRLCVRHLCLVLCFNLIGIVDSISKERKLFIQETRYYVHIYPSVDNFIE